MTSQVDHYTGRWASRHGRQARAWLTPELVASSCRTGQNPQPRTEITKKIWAYVRKNGLQDQQNRRMINADDKLRPL